MSSSERIPCSECDLCYAIGGGEGLCDFYDDILKKRIVKLFDVDPECPRILEKEKHEKEKI